MRLRFSAVLIAVVAMCASAWAYPSLLGPSGIVQTPTTDITEKNAVDVAADYVSLREGFSSIPVRLTAGISDKAELGLAYLKIGNDLDGRLVNLHGKVSFQREPDYPFGLAVGIEFGDLGEKLFELQDVNRIIRVYAVASKLLTPRPEGEAERVGTDIRGQIGVNYERIQNGVTESSVRPFVGLELATAGGTVIGAEWRSEKFGDDVVSAVIRHPFDQKTFIQAGVTKNLAGLAVSNKTAFFGGLGFRFTTPD